MSTAGAMTVTLRRPGRFGTMPRMIENASRFRRRTATVVVGAASLFACGNRGDSTRTTPPETPIANRPSGATPNLGGPSAIAAGADHTCVILEEGNVKCWGSNFYGELGRGDRTAHGDKPKNMGDALVSVDLGVGRTALDIAVGEVHTCALLDDGHVKCWGRNEVGQLGLGDENSRGDEPGQTGDALPAVNLGTGRTAVAITAERFNTCAVLDNHDVKCWGDNSMKQLGLGDMNDRGSKPGQMGDALPAVDLGVGRTALAISTSAHTCAILENHHVKCWGYNGYGELGLGDNVDRGADPGKMGDALPTVDLGPGRTVLAIATADFHTCALLDNHSVKCWGDNFSGQLGLGDTNNRGDVRGEMGDALPTVDLGTGRTALAIAAADQVTCALLDNHSVKCWGRGHDGQLGLGDRNNRGNEPGEMGDTLPSVELGTGRTATAVTAGSTHTCAILDDGNVKCWGNNLSGHLGLGDWEWRGGKPGQMGDALPAVQLK